MKLNSATLFTIKIIMFQLKTLLKTQPYCYSVERQNKIFLERERHHLPYCPNNNTPLGEHPLPYPLNSESSHLTKFLTFHFSLSRSKPVILKAYSEVQNTGWNLIWSEVPDTQNTVTEFNEASHQRHLDSFQ